MSLLFYNDAKMNLKRFLLYVLALYAGIFLGQKCRDSHCPSSPLFSKCVDRWVTLEKAFFKLLDVLEEPNLKTALCAEYQSEAQSEWAKKVRRPMGVKHGATGQCATVSYKLFFFHVSSQLLFPPNAES